MVRELEIICYLCLYYFVFFLRIMCGAVNTNTNSETQKVNSFIAL